jgi:GNAT superfamily N-acetyltransferase
MDEDLKIVRLGGQELAAAIDDLARLRKEVFREYPYLYDGSYAYEQKYLQTYCDSPQVLVLFVKDTRENKIVGASTGLPLVHETEEFKAPFLEQGYDPAEMFYCGESVLQQDYRGRGVYRQFFLQREEYARSLGLTSSCFCGIVRTPDHPLRPKGYRPLDDIWKHFGYRCLEGVTTHYPWKDVDQEQETNHLMQFWLKKL